MTSENEETTKRLNELISCIQHPDTYINQKPHKNTPDEDRDNCETITYSVNIRQEHLFSVQRFTRRKNAERFANNLIYFLFDDQGKPIRDFCSEQKKQIFDAAASREQILKTTQVVFWKKIETYANEATR